MRAGLRSGARPVAAGVQIHSPVAASDRRTDRGTGDADGYLGRRRRHRLACLPYSRLDNDNTLRFLNLKCPDLMSKAWQQSGSFILRTVYFL